MKLTPEEEREFAIYNATTHINKIDELLTSDLPLTITVEVNVFELENIEDQLPEEVTLHFSTKEIKFLLAKDKNQTIKHKNSL